MSIVWDDMRFEDEVYAVEKGVTIARISKRGQYYDVLPCPDSPKRFHDENSGIAMDSFRTLASAKKWIGMVADASSHRV
jgi:hypothetical protein